METRRAILAALAVALVAAPAASAKPGALDGDFGRDGRVYTVGGLHPQWDGAKAATAVSPDGSIFVATQRPESPYRPSTVLDLEVQLRRYEPSGHIDPGFGENGVVVVEVGPDLGFSLTDVFADSEGRPVLVGTSFAPATSNVGPYPLGHVHPSFATAIRYRTDGKLDASFGEGDGFALLDFGLPLPPGPFQKPGVSAAMADIDFKDRIALVAAQTEIGGERSTFVSETKLVARLTSDGVLDPTFGRGDGISPLTTSSVESMTVDNRGRLTLSLAPTYSVFERLARADVLHLTPHGTPDQTFGPGGLRNYAKTIVPGRIASDPHGRILVFGSIVGKREAVGLVRLKANGRVDGRFGDRGIAEVRLPGLSHVQGIASDRRGGAFLVGTFFLRESRSVAWRDARRAFFVIHRLPSGKLDRRFGRRGRVVTRFGREFDAGAREAALDSQGHLVVAGLAGLPKAASTSTQVLARYELTD